MSAIAIFTCRQNSHPFQERHVSLQEPVKIGRSVARSRPVPNNAVFDCKVLSRNHALLWYEDGVFYLQDTKSSNGTFINNQRLSKGAEESQPRELYSGDIVQFGVDVMENSRRVTHSCIIAEVQLFHPDGREATNEHSNSFMNNSGSLGSQSQELYQIAQYLQEALHREQMLENKLATLQRLVQQTQEASDSGWQALIDEDRLLSRLEVLENQLAAYSKNQTEDGLRQELTHLQEDKYNYESRAKESLHKVLQEKFDAVRKLSDLERSLSNTEDECGHLREMCESSQKALQSLAETHSQKLEEFASLEDQLQEAEKRHNDAVEAAEQEKAELQQQLDEALEEEHRLQAKVEQLQANNDFTKEQLNNMKAKMEAHRESNGETPRIYEQTNQGIQVDIVNLLDLQLLNAKDSDDEESSDDDDELKVKAILDCLDESIEDKVKLDFSNDSDSSKDNENLDPEDLKATVCPSTSPSLHQDKLKQAQAKIEKYKSQLDSSNSKLRESQKTIEKLQGEVQQLKSDMSDKVSHLALLEEQVRKTDDHMNNTIENAVSDLKAQLGEAKTLGDNSSSLTQQLRDQILSLEEELTSYRNSASTDTLVSSTNTDLDLTTSSDLDITTAVDSEVMTSDCVSPQSNDTASLLQEVEKLRGLLADANKSESEKNSVIEGYQMDVETTKGMLSESVTEISLLKTQLDEAKKTAIDKLEQNAKLRDQLCDIELSGKDVRRQIIALKDDLNEAQLNSELYKSEAEKLKLQVQSLHEELDYQQSVSQDVNEGTNRDLQSHASQTHREFVSLKMECASLRKRVQDIENEMGISRRENHKLQTDYYKLEESYHELEQLKDRLEDREIACQLNLANLTDSQKQSDQSLTEHWHNDSQLSQLQEDCSVFRNEINKLEESLHEMEEEYDFLAYKSLTVSACSIIPLIILVFAIVMAFYPFLSEITATNAPGS